MDGRLAAAMDQARGEVGRQIRAAFDTVSEVVYNVELALASRVDQTAAALDKAARTADLSQSGVRGVQEEMRGLQQRLEAQVLEVIDQRTQDAQQSRELGERVEAIDADTKAGRQAVDQLREHLEALALGVAADHDLLGALGERVEAVNADGTADRQAVDQLRERLEALALGVTADHDALGELGERVEAVAAEGGAAREAAEARTAEEIEARLDDWRRRLDNEIKSAIAAGREADELQFRDIEASLLERNRGPRGGLGEDPRRPR